MSPNGHYDFCIDTTENFGVFGERDFKTLLDEFLYHRTVKKR